MTFGNPAATDDAIAAISAKRLKVKDDNVWCKKHAPAGVRLPKSFLFALKKQLVDWQFNKSAIYVNELTSTMEVEGKCILEVASMDGKLELTWRSKEWEEWSDFQKDEAFTALVDKYNGLLSKAHSYKSKGDGKGSLAPRQ